LKPAVFYYVIILSVKALGRSGLLSALILCLTLFSCQQPGDNASRPASEKLRVLTTIAPLYSFTKNIAGDAAVVENLLPAGAGPHEYSLRPGDARKVADADVIIKNGVDLETWLDKLLSSAGEMPSAAGRSSVVTDTSVGVEIISNDPHIWLSPKNAVIQVKNIRDALMKADPANSSVYERNAFEYIKRLELLDNEIKSGIMTFKSRKFVSFHSAFVYLARDYGLTQAAVIQEMPETEPSAGHIADVIKIIRAEGIKSIFSQPGTSHKITGSLAGDLGLRVYSLDTLETGGLSGQWYEERMRADLEVLRKALN